MPGTILRTTGKACFPRAPTIQPTRSRTRPFSHASGLALFEAAAHRLTAAGVRCPALLLADSSRTLYPADIAVVEDVAGGSLEALLEKDPAAAERPLSVIADWLTAMAAVRSPSPGKVAFVDAGGRSPVTSCETITLDRALAQLAEIAGRDRRAAGLRTGSSRRCTRWPGRSARARLPRSSTASSARTTSCSTAAVSRC
jgi:hypothetical protein